MGIEPMNTGFADQRVSHFAIGASRVSLLASSASGTSRACPSSSPTKEQARSSSHVICLKQRSRNYFGCAAVRMYALHRLEAAG